MPAGRGAWRRPTTLECSKMLEEPLQAPVVLHYSNCGFANWVRKYEILGDFGDLWWGRCPIRVTAHLQSRDVIHRRPADEREGYFRTVLMCEGQLEPLRRSGLLVRIEFPRSVLEECEWLYAAEDE
eukprot:5147673-Prymnesium_polylepis.1